MERGHHINTCFTSFQYGLDMAHQSHSMNRNLAAANTCAYCHPLRGLEGMEEMRYDEWAVKKRLLEGLRPSCLHRVEQYAYVHVSKTF